MDPFVGQLINNKYRLVRLIGDGGMGSVFEARHELLGTTVALKFLHAVLARRKGLVERFLQEAQVSARIKSRHVVRVTDVDRTGDGLAYMVMEYVEGTTLQTLYEQLYQQGKRLTSVEAFRYILQIMEGVGAAHKMGIVHRDLKPDNVMLTQEHDTTTVKILDFGIAKLRASGEMERGLTRPGVVMGTPEYMAPEQAFSADAVDARADIFSLGVMFFEMLAGRRPVGGETAHSIAAQYLEGNIAQLAALVPSLDPALAAAVHTAMAPKPERRFVSVEALRNAIVPFCPQEALPARAELTMTPASVVGSLAAIPTAVRRVPKTQPDDEPPPAPKPEPRVRTASEPSLARKSERPPAADNEPLVVVEEGDAGAEPDSGERAVPTALVEEDRAVALAATAAAAASTPSAEEGATDLKPGERPTADEVGRPPSEASIEVVFSTAEPAAVPATDRQGPSDEPDAAPAGPDGASTAEATPYPAFAQAAAAEPRVAGTVADSADVAPGAGGTQLGAPFEAEGYPLPHTTQQSGHAFAPLHRPGAVPVAAAPAPRRKRGGPSFLTVLVLALGVSGAVVGGVYVAQRYSSRDDRRDDPPIKPPTAIRTVPTTPATVPATTTPLPPPPPPTTTTPPPATTRPPPTTTQPLPPPPASTPILVIPSEFPLPTFPGWPPIGPTPSPTSPQPTAPPPGTRPTARPRIPKG